MDVRNLFRKCLAALFVLVLVATNTVDAMAKVSDDSTEGTRDVEMYAIQYAISVDEAKLRFEMMDIAGELNARLTMEEADSYGGGWIEHTPEFRVVYQFTLGFEYNIKPYLIDFEKLTPYIKVNTTEHTYEQLIEIQSNITTAIRKIGIPVDTDIDIREGRIKVFVVENANLAKAINNNQITIGDNIDIEDVTQLSTDQIVTVQRVISPKKLNDFSGNEIGGGLTLTMPGGNWSTMGFSIVNNGTRGVVTAGHCSNTVYFNGTNLPFQTEYIGYMGDSQWHTTPGYLPTNKVKDWDWGTRNITGVRGYDNIMVGQFAAKYGATTGFTCGQIRSKNYNPTTWPPSYGNGLFIVVDNNYGYSPLSSGGDSGAPWFAENLALGVHKGSAADDYNDAVFMSVTFLTSIGCNILTSP